MGNIEAYKKQSKKLCVEKRWKRFISVRDQHCNSATCPSPFRQKLLTSSMLQLWLLPSSLRQLRTLRWCYVWPETTAVAPIKWLLWSESIHLPTCDWSARDTFIAHCFAWRFGDATPLFHIVVINLGG